MCEMVEKGFFLILDLTVVNSYIIYQHTRNEMKQKSVYLAFRRELIRHLIEPLLTSRLQPPIPQPISKERLKHQNAHYMEKRRKRNDCVVCSDRSENGMRHLTHYICTTRTDNPPLCPGECFQLYHTKKIYIYKKEE